MSGGGTKIQRYPPTTTPMITEAAMQLRNFFFLNVKIVKVAMKFAAAPRTTSTMFNEPKAITPPTAFPTRQPSVAPRITGQPNNAASGRRQSATLSCTGGKEAGARKITRTA